MYRNLNLWFESQSLIFYSNRVQHMLQLVPLHFFIPPFLLAASTTSQYGVANLSNRRGLEVFVEGSRGEAHTTA